MGLVGPDGASALSMPAAKNALLRSADTPTTATVGKCFRWGRAVFCDLQSGDVTTLYRMTGRNCRVIRVRNVAFRQPDEFVSGC
jgi:hypothetical protein